jgi:hypothetical protein
MVAVGFGGGGRRKAARDSCRKRGTLPIRDHSAFKTFRIPAVQALYHYKMAKGSQLVQLKAALSQAGITGQKNNSKKRKRSAAPLEKDKAKTAAKLEEIHRRLNPFDEKVTRLKHNVGGRKLKGITGKPAKSKQAGLEQVRS